MSIFSKPETQPQKPRERVVIPTRGSNGDGAISIIGHGMVIEGDVVTEGIVRIEGELKGTVRAAKAVIVGHAGKVDGHIITEDAVIGGTVEGAIMARSRIELQSSCRVLGVIQASPSGLKLEEGARFNGKIEMLEDERAGSRSDEEEPELNSLDALKGLRAQPGEEEAFEAEPDEVEVRASSAA